MYKEINLDDWTLCGGGAQGESYESDKFPDLMLKLYFGKDEQENAVSEHRMSLAAQNIGIVTPDPGEIVTDGTRIGVCFKKIKNKRSFVRIIGDEPGRIEEIAARFADEARKLHSLPVGNDEVPDYKSVLSKRIDNLHFKPQKEKRILEFLYSLPDASCYNHGDLHPGNMISDGTTDYWIDLGLFCKGIPEYDISMLYFVCHHTPVGVMNSVFHISVGQGRKFWKFFVEDYFGPDSPERRERLRLVKEIENMKLQMMAKRVGFGSWIIRLLTCINRFL